MRIRHKSQSSTDFAHGKCLNIQILPFVFRFRQQKKVKNIY